VVVAQADQAADVAHPAPPHLSMVLPQQVADQAVVKRRLQVAQADQAAVQADIMVPAVLAHLDREITEAAPPTIPIKMAVAVVVVKVALAPMRLLHLLVPVAPAPPMDLVLLEQVVAVVRIKTSEQEVAPAAQVVVATVVGVPLKQELLLEVLAQTATVEAAAADHRLAEI
jgi:hypothetical protein